MANEQNRPAPQNPQRATQAGGTTVNPATAPPSTVNQGSSPPPPGGQIQAREHTVQSHETIRVDYHHADEFGAVEMFTLKIGPYSIGIPADKLDVLTVELERARAIRSQKARRLGPGWDSIYGNAPAVGVPPHKHHGG